MKSWLSASRAINLFSSESRRLSRHKNTVITLFRWTPRRDAVTFVRWWKTSVWCQPRDMYYVSDSLSVWKRNKGREIKAWRTFCTFFNSKHTFPPAAPPPRVSAPLKTLWPFMNIYIAPSEVKAVLCIVYTHELHRGATVEHAVIRCRKPALNANGLVQVYSNVLVSVTKPNNS